MKRMRRIHRILSFAFPGVLQILRPEPRLRDGLMVLLGVGSLLGAIGLLLFLPTHDAPLETFFWLSIVDMTNIYPLRLMPDIQAQGTLTPILPESEALLVRIPFYWRTLGVYAVLYVLCAVLSFRDYGRSGQVRS